VGTKPARRGPILLHYALSSHPGYVVCVYPEHLVPEGEQGLKHSAPEPPEADYHEVTTHDVPSPPASLAVREGDIDYVWGVCGLTHHFESCPRNVRKALVFFWEVP
jgi:hypothetical protein